MTSPARLLRRSVLPALVAAIACLAPSTAGADEGLASLRAAGMGDNVVGAAPTNAAIFHNPAGLTLLPLYSLEAGYGIGLDDRISRLRINVADGRTNPRLAGGFSYTFSLGNGDEPGDQDNLRDHDIRVAAALPIVPEVLAIGATLRYMNYRRGRVDQDPDGDVVRYHGFTLDLGMMAKLGQRFFVGIAARDLINIDGASEDRGVAAGVGAVFGMLRLNGDWGVAIDRGELEHYAGLGVEYMIQRLGVRMGYRHLFAEADNALSIGVGYRSQTAGFDFAYRQYFNVRTQRELGLSLILHL